ncbi:MAG: hypothetical protein AAGE94_15735 [Acidobacteriota bacterium]
MARPTWDNARHVLRDFDGTTTDLRVTGLPLGDLDHVLSICAQLPSVVVTGFADETVAPKPLDGAWRRRLASPPTRSGQHVALLSAQGTPRHLQVYLWVVATESLEVECSFWNDLTFPVGIDHDEAEARLETLLAVVEHCRRTPDIGICVFSSEHNGPTEELIEKADDEVVFTW